MVSERIKFLTYNNFYGNLYFWRTTQQQEIDLIEEIDGKYSIYEFKINPRKIARFSKTFAKAYPVDKGMTVSPANIEDFCLPEGWPKPE